MPHCISCLPSPPKSKVQSKHSGKMSQLTDQIYGLCRNHSSVSSLLAENPSITPGEAAKKLYHPDTISISEGHPPHERKAATEDELEKAYQCGRFHTRPSDLFLRIFHDSLMPLEHDPLMGCCSPSLVGSSGVLPLTIIGPLPDICRHMVSRGLVIMKVLLF